MTITPQDAEEMRRRMVANGAPNDGGEKGGVYESGRGKPGNPSSGRSVGPPAKPSELDIVVYGIPAPQGSKRFVGHSKSGRGIMIESSAKVRPWREAVKWAAVEVLRQSKDFSSAPRFTGPLLVWMWFTLPKPKSAPKTRQTWPDRKPDLSKLVRSTDDALTDAGVWEDDARIIECQASKFYPGEEVGSMDTPGCTIKIMEAGQ